MGQWTSVLRAAGTLLVAAGCSSAAVLFTSPGTGTDRQGDAFTLGTSFDVLTAGNVVTALGIYDTGGQFQFDHQIGLWDHTASDTLVASATFLASSTNSGTPAGFLFISVSPVLLVSGHNYVLGAFYPGTFAVASGDHLLDTGGAPGTNANFGNFVSRFDTSNTGFQEPLGGAGDTSYIGPNLQFTPAPEPSTLLSLAGGLAGLAVAGWRRRRQG